jgi:hypothetical protein
LKSPELETYEKARKPLITPDYHDNRRSTSANTRRSKSTQHHQKRPTSRRGSHDSRSHHKNHKSHKNYNDRRSRDSRNKHRHSDNARHGHTRNPNRDPSFDQHVDAIVDYIKRLDKKRECTKRTRLDSMEFIRCAVKHYNRSHRDGIAVSERTNDTNLRYRKFDEVVKRYRRWFDRYGRR